MERQKKAYVYGMVAVLLWSTVASAFKLSLRHLTHVELLFYSSLASFLVLFAIVSARGRLKTAIFCGKKHFLMSLFLGVVNPFLYYLVLFKAYDLLPAQEAQPLNYTWALTLALLSIPLLRQKIGAADFAGLLVAYIGVVVISTRGEFREFQVTNPLGVGLALGSTVLWALYWIYSTKDGRDPIDCLFLNFGLGMPFVFAYLLFSGGLRVPSLRGIGGAAYVGAFEMSISFVVWLKALRLSENTAKIGSLIFISPFISLIFIWLFVGEEIHGSTTVGLLFIIAGLIIQKLRKKGREEVTS